MHSDEYRPLKYDCDGDAIQARLQALFGVKPPTRLPVKANALANARLHNARGKEWSQNELALAAGLDQSYVSRLESGTTKTSNTAKLLALASTIGVPLDEIAVLPAIPQTPTRPATDNSVTQTTASDHSRDEVPDDQLLQIAQILAEPILATAVHGQPFGNVYFPVALIAPSGERMTPESVLDFDDAAINLITGQIGSGKSMLIRELAAAAIADGDWVPIFLDRLAIGNHTVTEAIANRAAMGGFTIDIPAVQDLLTRDGVVLLIDGIDEWEEARRVACLGELTALKRRSPLTRIIVTARPGTEWERSEHVKLWRSAPLSDPELIGFAKRIASGCSEETIRRLRLANLDDTERLLSVPLFAAHILPLAERLQSPRQTFVEFLRDVFDLAVRRQNLSAFGNRRALRSQTSIEQLQSFFEALCYRVFSRYGDKPVHISDLRRQAALSVASSRSEPTLAEAMLDDIVSLSNFISEHNGHCTFLNRSICHFYAAAYLSELEHSQFSELIEDIRIDWRSWEPIITYLSMLAPPRYEDGIELPNLELLLSNGGVSYLSNYETFVATRQENDGGQLLLANPTLINMPPKMAYGNLRSWEPITRIAEWCPGVSLSALQTGVPTRLPRERIDFAVLVDILGDRLESSIRVSRERLEALLARKR